MRPINIFIPSEWSIRMTKADNCLKTDGSTSFAANMNANGFTVENLGDPTFDTDSVNKAWIDKYFLKFKDDGTIDSRNARFTNMQPPRDVNDAAVLKAALFCSGKAVVAREKRLLFDKTYSSMSEISSDMVFQQNIIAKVKLWLRLDENTATSFSVDFCKNRDIIFSKYYNYHTINLESSNEFCAFIEQFSKNDSFAINVNVDSSVVLSHYLKISRFI